MLLVRALLFVGACAMSDPSHAPPPVHGERGGGLANGATLHRVDAAGTRAEVVVTATGTALWLTQGDERWLHSDRGAPDRVALSTDGAHVAWFASHDGLPTLFVSPARPGAEPRQLTHHQVGSAKGGPPPGFVPPPVHEGELRFDGDGLRWPSPRGPQAIRWAP